MNKLMFLMIPIIIISCASYNPGEFAHVKKGEHPGKLEINAKVSEQYSNYPFTFINVTFGNFDEHWKRVRSVKITNISNMEKAHLIVGPDLLYWSKAMNRKLSIDNFNNQMMVAALTTAAVAGGVVAASEGNEDLGGLLVGGALTGATINDINRLIDTAEQLEIGALVPEDHLYSPFSIPPNLYVNKWVVLQLPSTKSAEFIDFEIEYLSGKKATYTVKL